MKTQLIAHGIMMPLTMALVASVWGTDKLASCAVAYVVSAALTGVWLAAIDRFVGGAR